MPKKQWTRTEQAEEKKAGTRERTFELSLREKTSAQRRIFLRSKQRVSLRAPRVRLVETTRTRTRQCTRQASTQTR